LPPQGCPAWEYSNDPRCKQVLAAQAAAILRELRGGQLDTGRIASDTRSAHRRLFVDLAPAGFDYYAGNYRGSTHACLRDYEVQVPGDPRVGAPAQEVALFMLQFGNLVDSGLGALDAAEQVPLAELSNADRVVYRVVLGCRLFVDFLGIHPYANGNGHAARLIMNAVLGRYGLWPTRWPVEPRPPDPPYTECITRYRDGDAEPLHRFVMGLL
jgi:fido (protein-threonine AMPylation protein)